MPARKATLCRLLGTLFLLSALAMLPVIAFAGITPGASPYCGGGHGCVWRSQPTILLSEEVRAQVGASAAARHRFADYVGRPDVRLGLAAVDAVDTVPFAFLLLSVGLALRCLGQRGTDGLSRALTWLRRASLAAIVWTLANPVYESLLETLLSPATPSGADVQVSIYFGDIASSLLLAFASFAAIWALEAGLRAQRELIDFV